jgi:hypothetical protein
VERGNRGIKELDSLDLHNVYSSLYIIQAITSRRLSGVGQVARKGERRGVYRVLSGHLRERDHLEKLIVDVRIILNVASRSWGRGRGLG